MKNWIYALIVILIASACSTNHSSSGTHIEIKDQWFYFNGKKVFIKALGYEIGARPGQDPRTDTIANLSWMRKDLSIIRKAGFNTIRTWHQLTEDQLKVVQESGLKIIFGLWIAPERNYDDPGFVRDAETLTNKLVAYTKKYDCIISYLVLNEPMTDHIYKVSGKATRDLLLDVKQILNKEHPGIPVSISANAAISDYLNEQFLDFYGFNCYNYYDGQASAMGYRGFLEWVSALHGNKKPLVITEFGYSVSEDGPGNYGYGGNTLLMQKDGILKCYRDILDAGATGACPFYYADGWWKGGDKKVHSAHPEAWFGFWGYSDIKDTVGSPRPVWRALSTYMKALVLNPKNEAVYQNKIPLEMYLDSSVARVEVKYQDRILYSRIVTHPGYLEDQLPVSNNGLKDMELAFEFYNAKDRVIKDESIFILVSDKPIKLPRFSIQVTPEVLDKSKTCVLTMKLEGKGVFETEDNLTYSFCHHIGWNPGTFGSISLKDQLKKPGFEVKQSWQIPDTCRVLTVSAGITVRYGKYKCRLHDQTLIYRGNWADEIGHSTKITRNEPGNR
jgi:exo-beta-1,3-glucanase (GH17 family)